jgi:hypothetical protein
MTSGLKSLMEKGGTIQQATIYENTTATKGQESQRVGISRLHNFRLLKSLATATKAGQLTIVLENVRFESSESGG